MGASGRSLGNRVAGMSSGSSRGPHAAQMPPGENRFVPVHCGAQCRLLEFDAFFSVRHWTHAPVAGWSPEPCNAPWCRSKWPTGRVLGGPRQTRDTIGRNCPVLLRSECCPDACGHMRICRACPTPLKFHNVDGCCDAVLPCVLFFLNCHVTVSVGVHDQFCCGTDVRLCLGTPALAHVVKEH